MLKVEIINFFVENGLKGGPISGPPPSETFENAIRGVLIRSSPLRKSPKSGMSPPLLIGQ